MGHGFKYYKTLNEASPIRRFWKAHFSDQFSGEVHVEKQDLERVLEIVDGGGRPFPRCSCAESRRIGNV